MENQTTCEVSTKLVNNEYEYLLVYIDCIIVNPHSFVHKSLVLTHICNRYIIKHARQ